MFLGLKLWVPLGQCPFPGLSGPDTTEPATECGVCRARPHLRALCPPQELLEHGVCDEVERVRLSERYQSMKVCMGGLWDTALFPRGQHISCSGAVAPPRGHRRSLRKWQLTPDIHRQPQTGKEKLLFQDGSVSTVCPYWALTLRALHLKQHVGPACPGQRVCGPHTFALCPADILVFSWPCPQRAFPLLLLTSHWTDVQPPGASGVRFDALLLWLAANRSVTRGAVGQAWQGGSSLPWRVA